MPRIIHTPSGSSPTLVDVPYTTAAKATSGDWTAFFAVGGYHYGGARESTNVQNSYIEWDVVLAAGTYTFALAHRQDVNRGQYQLSINGTNVGSAIEGYAAAGTTARHTVTGVTIASSGVQTVRLTMATKNASSSGFKAAFSGWSLTRTA